MKVAYIDKSVLEIIKNLTTLFYDGTVIYKAISFSLFGNKATQVQLNVFFRKPSEAFG